MTAASSDPVLCASCIDLLRSAFARGNIDAQVCPACTVAFPQMGAVFAAFRRVTGDAQNAPPVRDVTVDTSTRRAR